MMRSTGCFVVQVNGGRLVVFTDVLVDDETKLENTSKDCARRIQCWRFAKEALTNSQPRSAGGCEMYSIIVKRRLIRRFTIDYTQRCDRIFTECDDICAGS